MFTLYDKIQNQIGIIDDTWTFDEDTNNYLFQIKTFTNKNDSNLYTSEDSYLFELINRYTLYYNTTVYGNLDSILETMVSDLTNLISLNSLGEDNSDALRLVAERFTYEGDAKDYEVFISDKLIKVTFFQDNANAYKPFKEEVMLNDLDSIEDQFEKSYKMYKVLDSHRSHNNYTYTYFSDFYNIMYTYFNSTDSDDKERYLEELEELRNNVYYNTNRIIDQDNDLEEKEVTIACRTLEETILVVETVHTLITEDGQPDIETTVDADIYGPIDPSALNNVIGSMTYEYLNVESDEYSMMVNNQFKYYEPVTVSLPSVETSTVNGITTTKTTINTTTNSYKEFYLKFYVDSVDPENNLVVNANGRNVVELTDIDGLYPDYNDDLENYGVMWTALTSTSKLNIAAIMDKLYTFMIDRDMDKADLWDLGYYVIGTTSTDVVLPIVPQTDPETTETINIEDYVDLINVISQYTRVEQDTIKDKDV